MANLNTEYARFVHAMTQAKPVELAACPSPYDVECLAKSVADIEHAFREFYIALAWEAQGAGADVDPKQADEMLQDLFGDMNFSGALEKRVREMWSEAAE